MSEPIPQPWDNEALAIANAFNQLRLALSAIGIEAEPRWGVGRRSDVTVLLSPEAMQRLRYVMSRAVETDTMQREHRGHSVCSIPVRTYKTITTSEVAILG